MREAELRASLRTLAQRNWVPDRVTIDPEASAVPGYQKDEWKAHQPVAIYIRDDGWTIGTPRDFIKATEAVSDKWQGLVSGPTPNQKHLWTVQLKSTFGYWMSLGLIDPKTGEIIGGEPAVYEADEEQASGPMAPEGADLGALRDWLRKGT